MIYIKNVNEVEKMREAGRLVAKAHEAVSRHIKMGVTTWELDKIAEDVIKSGGGVPAFKGYGGFAGNICVSIDNEVIHGIPSRKRRLCEGEIVGVDIGAMFGGFHGDSAATYGVGKISEEAGKLIKTVHSAFYEGMAAARHGERIGEISKAVQGVVEGAGYSVVRDYVGHGIGRKLHEDPSIPNYYDGKRGVRLQRGMTLAIEPMINQGGYEVEMLDDDWTIVTQDGSLSAHYEHTILVTNGEPIILTEL